MRGRFAHIDFVPDLGQRIGSREWFRGILTLTALCGAAWMTHPTHVAITGYSPPALDAAAFDEVRSQTIAPIALGSDTGRHMAATDAVMRLAETPERPRIELTATVGAGDSFTRTLERAGVGGTQAQQVSDMVAGAMDGARLSPGTRIDIVLGRRESRSVPRPVEKIDFRARLDLALSINRTPSGLDLAQQHIAIDNTPLRITGAVGDSLFRSARAAGAPAKAVQAYLKVLAGHLSISRDVQAGDRYDLVVAQRRAETGEVEIGDLLYAGLSSKSGKKKAQLLRWAQGKGSTWFEASGVGETRSTALSLPVSGGRISSKFGKRFHPVLGFTRMHEGVDIAVAYGTPIRATADGKVVYAGWHGGHGKFVKIDHGGHLAMGYAHMSKIAARSGAYVKRGQVIGYVGSTGLSTGPHVHYEIYRNGKPVNPMSISVQSAPQLAGKELRAFKAKLAELTSLRSGAAEVQSAAKAEEKPKTLALR